MNYDDLFRETACVRIKKGTGRTLKAGGAWIYDNEIDAISGATITSKAVTGAMNSCLAYFQSLEGGN